MGYTKLSNGLDVVQRERGSQAHLLDIWPEQGVKNDTIYETGEHGEKEVWS